MKERSFVQQEYFERIKDFFLPRHADKKNISARENFFLRVGER
jgi:hypothetical protein